MTKQLTPQRRAAVLLASLGAIIAATSVPVAGNLQGRGHDLFIGIAIGLSLAAIAASVTLTILSRRTICS